MAGKDKYMDVLNGESFAERLDKWTNRIASVGCLVIILILLMFTMSQAEIVCWG